VTLLLAVSPHLDDAVFSAGALLAREAAAGTRVVVATCFTASVPDPQGFALACQLDKGLGPEIDYMALRRAEDREACARLGAEPMHLPLPEAPNRGYDDAVALFGPPLAGDTMREALLPTLSRLLADLCPDRVLGPAAIGNHVDHSLVRDALTALVPVGLECWADLPYAARPGMEIPSCENALPCSREMEIKLSAAAAYRSQLPFQFGSPERMRTLLAIDGAEMIWPGSRSGFQEGTETR
jgi:LmbE family N-acetylglucosaminyl deacetylase